MNRRQFLASGAVSTLALGVNPASAEKGAPSPTPALMKLGDQSQPTTETHLKYQARYGVRNVCAYPRLTATGFMPPWTN